MTTRPLRNEPATTPEGCDCGGVGVCPPCQLWEANEWAESFRRQRDMAALDVARMTRLFNRLEAAVSHHKKAHMPEGDYFTDVPDEALWKARDKILKDFAEGK